MAVFTALATFLGTTLLTTLGFGAGATILGVSAASAIGGAVLTGGLVALNYFLTPSAKASSSAFQSPATQYQAVLNQSVAPRRRGYGVAKLGGPRAFFDSAGGELHQIIMLHHGEITQVAELFLGDQSVTLDVNGAVEQNPALSFVYLFFTLGAPNQSTIPSVAAAFPGIWTAEHRLRGIAYIAARFISPPAEQYLSAFPEGYNTPVRATCQLSKVFDPRTGLTEWSDNPALCIRDYLIHPDGYRLLESDIDGASFIAFANICDQQVVLAAGGSEKRYRLWGLYTLNDDPKDTLSRMLATCDGELYETPEGKISIRGGIWSEPSVVIEDRDILSFDLEQGNDAFSAFNQLRILYTSPLHDYQSTEAQRWDDLGDQATRGEVSQDFTVDMCPSPSQARRLAKIFRAKQNPRWRGTISTNMVGLNARGERMIRVVLPELQIDEDFMIVSHAIRADMTGCEIGILSLDEGVYDWSTGEEGSNPALPQSTTPDPTLEVPTGLLPVVESRQITSATVAPVVVASVNIPARVDLQLEAQIKLPSASIWENMSTATGEFEAVSGVLVDGATYAVRARFTNAAAAGPWSTEEAIVITANPTAPAAPSGYSVTKVGSTASLAWTNPAANFFRSRVFRSATNTFGGATAIAIVSGLPGQPGSYIDTPGTGTWYYWVVALNESNIASSPTASGTVTI